MPPLPGETLLLNVFADVHYYFNQSSVKSVHHRFDKGSYVYLYHNSTQRRARLEIANAAGTPEQDAFSGYLDTAVLINSYKQPNLFSIVVEGAKPASTSPRPADHSQWHLPAFDPKNEQKYLYKIHSLDLYLWTEKDADLLLNSIKRVIHPQQLGITEASPPLEHDGSMSPVVQQLERIVIATPAHARAPSSVSNQNNHGMINPTPENHTSGPYRASPTSAPAPVVAPYNPAAPSAPEPIAHREKTPPPIDAANGTGLTTPATQDYPSQYVGPLPQFAQTQPQQASFPFPGPPQRTTSLQSLPPPPPPPGQTPHHPLSQNHSFAGPPSQPQYATYPPQQQQQQYPQPPGFQTPVQSPGLPQTPGHPPAYIHTPLSPSFPIHTPLQSPGLPSQQSGGGIPGFANYTYAPHDHTSYTAPQPQQAANHHSLPTTQQASQAQSGVQEAYNIHNQAYIPTDAEAAHGKISKQQQSQAGQKGGLEQRMGRVEKGVGRFLRKLDQKI